MIIGVDYHPSFQQIAFFSEETGECGEQRLGHDEGGAERFYRDLKQRGISVRVGMEATGYSRWFERLLAELGFELWIGDPAEIRTRRAKKQKTDCKDAELLLKLMREDCFPRIWTPSPENPFELLLILLDRPGDVVTREELRTGLWPADVYVDFDRSLNKAIVKLREALGDSSGCPIYVETLPRIRVSIHRTSKRDDASRGAGRSSFVAACDRVRRKRSRNRRSEDPGTGARSSRLACPRDTCEHFGPRVRNGNCAPPRFKFELGE